MARARYQGSAYELVNFTDNAEWALRDEHGDVLVLDDDHQVDIQCERCGRWSPNNVIPARRGGWAAQGVKKRCCLPPAVDGLSGPTPAATRPWWGVACTFGAVPASPTVSLLSAGQGPSPGRLAHEPGMGAGPGAG